MRARLCFGQVCATQAASASESTFPTIYQDMKGALTGYGLGMMAKQMAASSKYGARAVNLTCLQDSIFPEQPVNSFVESDPDLMDHCRFETAEDLRKTLRETGTWEVVTFQVDLLHTISNQMTSPHFVVLHDKVHGREAYQNYLCTCGSGIRCGVPCRHYWAVLKQSTTPAFHRGLVNDLWFKEAEPLGMSVVNLHLFDNPKVPRQNAEYYRPVYSLVQRQDNELQDNEAAERIRKDLSMKRKWGALLGEAKKAIERALETGLEDGLYAYLRGFGGAGSTEVPSVLTSGQGWRGGLQIQNPTVVKGKGRPKGSVRLGAPSSSANPPPPPMRQPLQVLACNRAGTEPVQQAMGGAPAVEGPPTQAAPFTKKLRLCGCCQKIAGHNARTCPDKRG